MIGVWVCVTSVCGSSATEDMIILSIIVKKYKKETNQADEQYTERNKLDLAVPRRPFAKIV